jgi:hypothetical protein
MSYFNLLCILWFIIRFVISSCNSQLTFFWHNSQITLMHSSLWKDGLIVMWKSLLFPASCSLLKLEFVSLITWLLWIPKLNMFLFCPADFRDKFIFWTMVNLQELCSCYRGSYHKVGRKDKVSIPCWLLSLRDYTNCANFYVQNDMIN